MSNHTSGLIYAGKIPTVEVGQDSDFRTILRWADSYRSLRIHANLNSASDLAAAVRVNADGIGCMRSDMLFRTDSERRDLTKAIFLAESEDDRAKFLDQM